MHSLKSSLILWAVGSSVALLAVAGGTLYWLARDYLLDEFDSSLSAKAQLLASDVESKVDGPELDFSGQDMSEFEEGGTGFCQVWHQGKSLFRSESFSEAEDPAREGMTSHPTDIRWFDLPTGRRGRGFFFEFEAHVDPEPDEEDPEANVDPSSLAGMKMTMFLGRDSGGMSKTLGMIQLALLGVGAALACLMAVVIGWGVRRGLRPVDELASELARLDEHSLGRKLSTNQLPAELNPIVEQFGALLARLRTALERERSFSADMAHELRTPLAGLRSTIEVSLARPRTGTEYTDCLNQLLEVSQQMHVMVEGLMHLAAMENGRVKPIARSVQIDQQIDGMWRTLGHNGCANRKFQLNRTANAIQEIQTDPQLLALILRNILHNAMTYVNEGGQVSISSQSTAAGVEVSVSNTGSRVPSRSAAMVFDRFWRADQSRSGTGSRFGLGLALAKMATQALGGTIEAESEEGGEFQILLRIPSIDSQR